MRKELKYFLYVATILGFLIFVGSYYFSDNNKKNSYRSTKLYDSKIIEYNNELLILESDTEDIVEYVENNLNKDKKKYKFWELFNNDKELFLSYIEQPLLNKDVELELIFGSSPQKNPIHKKVFLSLIAPDFHVHLFE